MIYLYNKDGKEVKLDKALRLLKINLETFKNICIMLNIRPKKTATYTKKELNRIYNSKAYRELKRMSSIESKRIKYIKAKRIDLANRLPVVEHDYDNVLKIRFPNFKDAVMALGECLIVLNIYLKCNLSNDEKSKNSHVANNFNNLGESKNNNFKNTNDGIHDINNPEKTNLHDGYENFILENQNIDSPILKTKNVNLDIFQHGKKELLSAIQRAIDEFYAIAAQNSFCKTVTITNKGLFMNFEIKTAEFFFLVVPEGQVDVSRIEKSVRFYLKHLEAVNTNIKGISLMNAGGMRCYDTAVSCADKTTDDTFIVGEDKKGLFKNKKFQLDCCFEREIRMLVLSMGGEIVNNVEIGTSGSIICITETVKKYIEGVTFVYPQFVIDSFNRRKLVDMSLYLAGKEYPEHYSPFSQEKIKLEDDDWFFISDMRKKKIRKILETEDFCLEIGQ